MTDNLRPLRSNVPIPEIPHGEDLWLIVLITAVKSRRTSKADNSLMPLRATQRERLF
jgi:hypothetical protein